MQMYRSVSADELEAARTARFADDFFEFGGPAPGEPWRIRHWLPLDPMSYCALIMPWKAYRSGPAGWAPVRDEPFEDILGAYEFLSLPAPVPVNLARWRTDFKIIESARVVPPMVRSALDRFSLESDAVFVRSHRGMDTVHNWKIDRALFLELADPFVEMPEPFGTKSIFPRRVPWFMHSDADEAVIYLAGSAELIDTLERIDPRRVIRVSPNDLCY